MPIEAVHETSHRQLVLCIKSNSTDHEKRIDDVVNQLDTALDIIRARLPDTGVSYFTLDISRSYKAGEEFNPLDEHGLAKWGLIGMRPRLHQQMKAWLAKLERLIVDARIGAREQEGLWEHPEVQFGEVAACALALSDRSFVPYYVRLLRAWNLDAAEFQPQAVELILLEHGICLETEDLLLMIVAEARWEGLIQHLFPLLQEKYGNFPASPLFRRMVEGILIRDRAWYKAYLESLGMDNTLRDKSERHPFFNRPEAPGLSEAAARIFAEFDDAAARLPKQ